MSSHFNHDPKKEGKNVPLTSLKIRPVSIGQQSVTDPQKVKYRNPECPFEVWSGAGARPRWLRKLIKIGYDLDSFRVDDKEPSKKGEI